MERTAVVKKITEEILTEFNAFHDRLGRLAKAADAAGPVVDFDRAMAHGLRPGHERLIGHVRVNGVVLKGAMAGIQANGNRFIRGIDNTGKVRHIALGNAWKTKIGKPRPAHTSERNAMDLAYQKGGVSGAAPAPVAPPMVGKATMTPNVPSPGKGDEGDSRLLKSLVSSMKALGGDEKGIHESHVVTFSDGSKALWKPMPTGQIDPKREAVAYEIAKELGMSHLVPETVIREIDGRVGSLQRFVDDAKVAMKIWDEKEMYDGEKDLARSAAFDYLICHTDRHDGNWMVDSGGSLHLIDHGFSLPTMRIEPHYSLLIDRAKRTNLSTDLVRTEWANKWPNVESALGKRGIPPQAIELAKERYFKLMASRTFLDL